MTVLTRHARCPALPDNLCDSWTEVRNRVSQLGLNLVWIISEGYGELTTGVREKLKAEGSAMWQFKQMRQK